MTSLLSQFNLANRIVEDINLLEENMLQKSNYDYANSLLKAERVKSLDYLTQNL